MIRPVTFTLNGASTTVRVDNDRMLLWVLRYDLGLTGTRFGCGAGLCGACTVIVDDKAVRSCSTAVKEIAGRKVLTIEGLSREGALHPLQQAFLENNAFQCGFCTSGMILNAYAFLLEHPRATHSEIVAGMNDNLCRCGSHRRILAAIEAAATAMAGRAR